jgi:hypothetical protein
MNNVTEMTEMHNIYKLLNVCVLFLAGECDVTKKVQEEIVKKKYYYDRLHIWRLKYI